MELIYTNNEGVDLVRVIEITDIKTILFKHKANKHTPSKGYPIWFKGDVKQYYINEKSYQSINLLISGKLIYSVNPATGDLLIKKVITEDNLYWYVIGSEPLYKADTHYKDTIQEAIECMGEYILDNAITVKDLLDSMVDVVPLLTDMLAELVLQDKKSMVEISKTKTDDLKLTYMWWDLYKNRASRSTITKAISYLKGGV